MLRKIPGKVRSVITRVVPRLFKGDLVNSLKAVVDIFVQPMPLRSFLKYNAKRMLKFDVWGIWANFKPRFPALVLEPLLAKRKMPLVRFMCAIRQW